MLKLYNTLTRKKEVFKPIKVGKIGMYVCGPTLNGIPHLGHAMSQISFDVLRRYLIFSGFDVEFVSNITDIDDKIIAGANEAGIGIDEFSEKNLKAHTVEYEKLNIMKPDVQPRATDYVKDMIGLVKKLEKKGVTYLIEGDGVYFDISKFDDYGKLSGQNVEDLEGGKRVAVDGKKNNGDFALWKLAKEGEPSWDSPWGEGRPGWHIECSAMSEKILGLPFDIHGGGSDLIFPHHEDEVAQSETGYGKEMAKFWVHNGMVTVGGKKMGKSLGNFKNIEDLDYAPMVIRYFVVSNQYRKPLDFSKTALDDARNSYERLKRLCLAAKDARKSEVGSRKSEEKVNEKYLKMFEKEMDDDLNAPRAMAVLWKLVRDSDADGKVGTIRKMDEVFGLELLDKEEVLIPAKVQDIVDEREGARAGKDFARSDLLRDRLKDMGWIVRDGKDGVEVEKG